MKRREVKAKQTETRNDLKQSATTAKGSKVLRKILRNTNPHDAQKNSDEAQQRRVNDYRDANDPNKNSLCDVNRHKHTKRQSKHQTT